MCPTLPRQYASRMTPNWTDTAGICTSDLQKGNIQLVYLSNTLDHGKGTLPSLFYHEILIQAGQELLPST